MENDKEVETTTPPTEEQNPQVQEETVQNIDYKAELESERKRRENAEAVIRRHKEARTETPTDDIDSIVEKKVSERLAGVEQRTAKYAASLAAKAKARTPEEAELIMFHFENSIVPTGDIDTDISRATLIANAKRIEQENAELKRRSIAQPSSGGGDAGARKPAPKPSELSPEDAKFAQRFGVTAEDLNKTPNLDPK